MKTLLMVTLIVTGALAIGQGYNMPTYSDFDTDGNGKVTQKEFESTQQKRMAENAEAGRMMRNAGNAPTFINVDTNSDGNIDAKEFQTHQAANRKNMGRGQGRNR